MPDPANNEQRIVQLEEKLAFAEKTVSELDEVLRSLNHQVTALRGELADLRDRVGAVETGPGGSE